MSRLEEQLRRVVVQGDDFLDEIATHLIAAGGKRLRPALTLAAASLGEDEPSDNTLLGGVSVELVHLASLYHDDVMDEATHRRNVVSVNARWGNLLAIVAGDFLLARSAEIAAALGPEVAGLLAATLARLCKGQVAEVRSAYRLDRSEDDYFEAISNKTAALMSTACRIGAITANLAREDVESLTVFGESLGMVFQIRDDVLDVVASEAELGKEPGQDLAEGIYTLPVQHALLDPRVGAELRSLLGKPLKPEQVEIARRLVSASSGIAASAEHARRYALAAAKAAEGLGDGPVPKALAQLGLGLLDDLERCATALAS
jgi:heptaprenyl diphosphate synthase